MTGEARDGLVPVSQGPAFRRDEKNEISKSIRPPMGMLAGVLFGLSSAVLYTATNVALRHCVDIDAFLVSAVKAIPTVAFLGPYLVWMIVRGELIASSFRMVPRFILAALLGQFVGNAFFQLALGRIGLAVSVPITLGTMIIGAAIFGRWLLHEKVKLRTLVAMLILLASILVLSSPSSHPELAQQAVVGSDFEPTSTAREVGIGSLCAAMSGIAYAVFGTVMRQALTGGLSAPFTMFLSGSVGAVALWAFSFYRIGAVLILEVPPAEWGTMVVAGLLNFCAFVSLSIALKSLPVVAVNLLNASQVAMAALAGIIFFSEPVTSSLITGVGLTLLGLLVMVQRKRNNPDK
jgi:drug/metabolite transporter (DMT)-like permease